MHGVSFLQDLAIVMIVAGLVTVLFHRLKLPVVLGYIIAGVIVGPHTSSIPLVVDRQTIQTLSELGVILLLFSLGLEFSLRKLREVGAAALITATLKILLMIWVGYGLGGLFGWKRMDSIFLGAILSISSTTIIVKALDELHKRKEKFADVIYGILIVEDILAILMIALLSGFATTGSLQASDVQITLVRLLAFLVAVLVIGLLAVPRFLNYVAKFKSNEMLLVSVLGLCFGVSLLAARLGYSVALGAFLIGAIIAEARQIGRIEALMEPVRDMFSAVFFVSIGLLIDPSLLAKYWVPTLVITVVIVFGKVIACAFGAFVAGNDRQSAVRIGMGLVPIGEFSFIIAALGTSLKVTSDFQYPIAVSVSAITTLLTPFLIRRSDALVEWADRKSPRAISNYLDLYTRWIRHLRQSQPNNVAWKLVRLWVLQMTLCIVLVTGIFISATFFCERALAWWPESAGRREWRKGGPLADGNDPEPAAADRRRAKASGAGDAVVGDERDTRRCRSADGRAAGDRGACDSGGRLHRAAANPPRPQFGDPALLMERAARAGADRCRRDGAASPLVHPAVCERANRVARDILPAAAAARSRNGTRAKPAAAPCGNHFDRNRPAFPGSGKAHTRTQPARKNRREHRRHRALG